MRLSGVLRECSLVSLNKSRLGCIARPKNFDMYASQSSSTANVPGPSFVNSASRSSGQATKVSSAGLKYNWHSAFGIVTLILTVVAVVGLAYVYWYRKRKSRAVEKQHGVANVSQTSNITHTANVSHATSNVSPVIEETDDSPSTVTNRTSGHAPTRSELEKEPRSEELKASVRKARNVNREHERERAERAWLKNEQSRLRDMKRMFQSRKAEWKIRLKEGGTVDDRAKQQWREERSRMSREIAEGRQNYKKRLSELQQRKHERRQRREEREALRRSRHRRSLRHENVSDTSDYSSFGSETMSDSSEDLTDSEWRNENAIPASVHSSERERRLLMNAMSPLIAAPMTEQTVAENQRLGSGCLDEAACMASASMDEPYTRHLDLRAARLALYEKQTSEPLPADLRKYKLQGGKDTGIHTKWSKSERSLSSMLSLLSQGLRHAYRFPQERLAINATEDFISRFKTAYESSSGKNGENDTSILCRLPPNVTCQLLDTLAVYLLLPPRYTEADSVRAATDLTLAVAVTPTQYRFPTVRLSDAEAVRSLAAWLIAAYRRHGGSFDAQLDASIDGAGLLNDSRFPLRQNEFEPGLHLDGGYYSRSRTPSFEMLRAASDPQLEFTFHLIRAEANPRVVWERVHRITSHRTIAVGLCGFNVPPTIGAPCNRLTLTNPNSTNGIEVIPSCRYLRFFTPTLSFAVCGQSTGKAYFDSSFMDRRTPQYAVQYRNVHYSDSSSKFSFPANGMLNRVTDKELVNSDGKTLDAVEYPDDAKSFVAKWERYGVMYQAYRIEKLAPADVREIVLVDSQEERITIIAEITNLSPEETLTYHFTERHRIEPGAKRCFKTQFEMTPNGREMTCTTGDSDFPAFPLRVDERFVVHVFCGKNNSPYGDAVLMVDEQPRVCVPLSCPVEKALLHVPVHDGRVATFAHHPAENQWLFSAYA